MHFPRPLANYEWCDEGGVGLYPFAKPARIGKVRNRRQACGESASANGLELILGHFPLPNLQGLAKGNRFAKGERLFRTFVT